MSIHATVRRRSPAPSPPAASRLALQPSGAASRLAADPGHPDAAVRVERAERFGHSFARIGAGAGSHARPLPAAVPAVVIQRVEGDEDEGAPQGGGVEDVEMRDEAPQDVEMEDADSFDKHQGFFGVKQQGKVSTDKGKQYAGPESMKGKRAEQVIRQITNLILNRLAAEQKAAKGPNPVEIQMSSVGGKLLVNSNNPKASRALYDNVTGAGGLSEYALAKEALKPAGDKDAERPERLQEKLRKALAGERKWQKDGAEGEDREDVARAMAILESFRGGKPGILDPNEMGQPEQVSKDWNEPAAPRSYVVLHGPDDLKTEHAERVQTKVRAKYLAEHESGLSTNPTGPKTPCLGCSVFHEANHPEFAPTTDLNGAYFEGSSPVTTPAEKEIALELVKKRPSTGSVSQTGYLRNSDNPDSDSDAEGNEALPRPVGYSVPFGGPKPKTAPWMMPGGKTEDLPVKTKRQQLRKKLKRKIGGVLDDEDVKSDGPVVKKKREKKKSEKDRSKDFAD